ncbi:MAG: hypothetical protein ACFE85_16245 [Candidatus Hodarchaeota archaeon]
MLYFIFIFNSKDGDLLYDKDLNISNERQMDLFGSFYTALKTFLGGVMGSGAETLKTVGLGQLNAYVINLSELSIDLVLIAEKEDFKDVTRISQKISDLILSYKELFTKERIETDYFREFDDKVNELILSEEKVVDPLLLIEKKGDILKSIWSQKGKLSEQVRAERKKQIEQSSKEIELLSRVYLNERNILKKLNICSRIIDISEKVENESKMVEYQKYAKTLIDEIEDRKLRLAHFLERTKQSLKDALDSLMGTSIKYGQYRDVYSSLYSFSSKLKNLTSIETRQKYIHMANKLLEPHKISQGELSRIISEIRNMNDDIESYFV